LVTQLLLHLGKGKLKAENPHSSAEEGLVEQTYTKNNAESERIYPAVPTKKAFTYTFDLKG